MWEEKIHIYDTSRIYNNFPSIKIYIFRMRLRCSFPFYGFLAIYLLLFDCNFKSLINFLSYCLPTKKNILVYGSVWIRLILLKLKTYYWNHCSKIIFKCVNNTVGPIFNEKIDKKWNLWVCEQCTDALFTKKSKVAVTVHVPYMNSNCLWGENAWKKKKKEGKRRNKTQTQIQTLLIYGTKDDNTQL